MWRLQINIDPGLYVNTHLQLFCLNKCAVLSVMKTYTFIDIKTVIL